MVIVRQYRNFESWLNFHIKFICVYFPLWLGSRRSLLIRHTKFNQFINCQSFSINKHENHHLHRPQCDVENVRQPA